MVASPQPPRRGVDGWRSHRLRAWLMSSGGGSGSGGSGSGRATGSGALIESRPPEPKPEPPHPHPPLPRPQTPLSDDDLDDADDLAPTLPRIPSIPRLPSVKPPTTPPSTPPAVHMEPSRLRACADFAAFLCSRNYMRGPRLDGLTIEQRMRLFSLVGQVYLPALGLAGRMPGCDAMAHAVADAVADGVTYEDDCDAP